MAKAKNINIQMGSANMVMFGVVSIIAVVAIWVLWLSRQQIKDAVVTGSQTGTGILNNIIGLTRDVKEDSTTIGSRAWAWKQVDKIKDAIGIEEDRPNLYEQGIYEPNERPHKIIWKGEIPTAIYEDDPDWHKYDANGELLLPFGVSPYSS